MVFSYSNIQSKQVGGKRITHKVSIKNNKGFKSVSHFRKGKHVRTIKKPISKQHIQLIKSKNFIKGLFKDCKTCKKTNSK